MMIHLRSISRRALLVATSSSTFALLSAKFAGAQELESAAANRAVEISALEAARNFDAVYDLMHPDAQAIIPRAAVVGWYQNFFADQDAGVLTVTGVSIVSWQWPVTGQIYDQTAEVSFVQPFTRNGVTSNEPEIVRLVDPGDGRGPRWFFGRSREFVDAQIALYQETSPIQQDGTGEYDIIELGVLPGLDYSSPDAINNDGLVAGTCFLRGNPGFAGFVWENGVMQALAERTGQPGNINFPSDVNNSGVIVGGSSEFEGPSTAFRIKGTSFEDLGTIDDLPNAIAQAINDDGVIVGWCTDSIYTQNPFKPARAVIWTDGQITRLETNSANESHARGLNAAGDFVGDATWNGASQAVVWIEGQVKLLPQFSSEIPDDMAVGINSDRTVIGNSNLYAGQSVTVSPWAWSPGMAAPQALAVPGDASSVTANAINDAGWIIGTVRGQSGSESGLLWRDGEMIELTNLLPPNSGWKIIAANDINDRNEIAAQASRLDDDRIRIAVMLTPAG